MTGQCGGDIIQYNHIRTSIELFSPVIKTEYILSFRKNGVY